MKTFLVTIIKMNGVKVSFQVNASSETTAFNKTRRNWGKELKEFYDIEELY